MDLVATVVSWLVVAIGAFFIGGTALSLSHHPHWFVRGWDFPRLQVAGVIAITGAIHALFFFRGAWYDWAFVGAAVAATAWQLWWILPYTPVTSVEVEPARADKPDDDMAFRLVASNVLRENEEYDRWLRVIRGADPDVILAVEVDDTWLEQIRELEEDYPHTVFQPQDNYYGMVLFSRLPLIDPKLRFVVQEDIPSIHTEIELPGGKQIWLHGVHPRPPEPVRDQDATPRDAEVVIIGREIGEEGDPAVVCGDFNDVAWSHTTQLFLSLSHMLDPRKGRGLYNTFDANSRFFRFPVDHVFHTNEFKLINLEILDDVGSDHFPVCIDLQYEPVAELEHPEPEANGEEQAEAEEKVENAEDEIGGVDRNPL